MALGFDNHNLGAEVEGGRVRGQRSVMHMGESATAWSSSCESRVKGVH